LLGLIWNSVNFLDDRLTEVLFEYMLISEVSYVIESETEKGKKVKLLKPMGKKNVFNPTIKSKW